MNCVLRAGLSFLMLSAVEHAFSQNAFQMQFPGLVNSYGNNATRGQDGGVTFVTWGTDMFGQSGWDVVLISANAQGDTLWTRAFGRPSDDNSFCLTSSSDGGYLIAGSTIASGTNPATYLYLIKTNANGDTSWTRSFSRSGYDIAYSADACPGGGYVVVGTSGGGGLFILRISQQGQLLWSRLYDLRYPPDFDSQVTTILCVTATLDSCFIVSGAMNGSDFIAKIDADGNLLWTRLLDEADLLAFRQVVATSDGGWAGIGPIFIDNTYDSFLARFDAEGNTTWLKHYEGEINEVLYSLVQTTGGFGAIGFVRDSLLTEADCFYVHLDSLGGVLSTGTFGTGGNDVGQDIVEASDGGSYLVGWTESFGFDPAAFLMKTDPDEISGCFHNPISITATDTVFSWFEIDLQSFPAEVQVHSGACSVRAGIDFLALCPTMVDDTVNPSSNFHVFPNPTSEHFTASIASVHLGSRLEIFSAIGDQVYDGRIDRTETVIDCSSFSRGIYLLKVTTEHSSAFQKLFLE